MSDNMNHTIQNAVRRAQRVSLLLSIAAPIIHLMPDLRKALLYDRLALANKELWRLLTCHWVHLNADHLFWSGMTFLVLASLCEVIDKTRCYVTTGVSALLIPAAIWVNRPDLQVYTGLSGLDCALYALLIVMFLKREIRSRNPIWACFYGLLLVILIAKITYETITGLTIFVGNNHADMLPVPFAHFVGGVVGCVVGMANRKSGLFEKQYDPEKTVNDLTSLA
jgi:rhomboid family GlyGly-CTERM serine protease